MITIEQFIASLDKKIESLNEANIIYPIAGKVQEMQVTRIFDQGRAADGSAFGTYSTKETYVAKKEFKNTSAFKAAGKNGETKFKNGKPHTSMFIADGYKGLKEKQGYESEFVNLTYSADLRNDFATGIVKRDGTCVSILKRQTKGKIAGLEAKYGRIFRFNQAEIDFFKTEGAKALTKYFFGLQTYS